MLGRYCSHRPLKTGFQHRLFNPTRVRYKNKEQILQEIGKTVVNSRTASSGNGTFSVVTLIFVVPTVLSAVLYTGYNTYRGKPTFLPLWFQKKIPISKVSNIEHVDLDVLQDHTEYTLLNKLSMDHRIRTRFGLPLKMGPLDQFDVYVEYHDYACSGIEIDPINKFPPKFSWITKEVLVHDKFNNILEPMNIGAGVEDDGKFNVIENEKKVNAIRDYNIVIHGRAPIASQFNPAVTDGAVTFTGIIEFDHTKMIKIKNVKLIYRLNGNVKIEPLW